MRTYCGIGGATIEMANPASMAMQLIGDIKKCAGQPAWVDLLLETNAANIKWLCRQPECGHFRERINDAVRAAKQ